MQLRTNFMFSGVIALNDKPRLPSNKRTDCVKSQNGGVRYPWGRTFSMLFSVEMGRAGVQAIGWNPSVDRPKHFHTVCACTRRRYASSEIGAILKVRIGYNAISIYLCGAGDAQTDGRVRRQPR